MQHVQSVKNAANAKNGPEVEVNKLFYVIYFHCSLLLFDF